MILAASTATQGLFASAAGAFAPTAGLATLSAYDVSIAGLGLAMTPFAAANDHHSSTSDATEAHTILSNVGIAQDVDEYVDPRGHTAAAAVASSGDKLAVEIIESISTTISGESSFEATPNAAVSLSKIVALIGLRLPTSITSRTLPHDDPIKHSIASTTFITENANADGGKSAPATIEPGVSLLTPRGKSPVAETGSPAFPSSPMPAASVSMSSPQHNALSQHRNAMTPNATTAMLASTHPAPYPVASGGDRLNAERLEHETSSRLFVGSNDIPAHRLAGAPTGKDMLAVLTAHLTLLPPRAPQREHPVSIPLEAEHRGITLTHSENGTAHIAMIRGHRDEALTMHFERNVGGMHFAGISRNDPAVPQDVPNAAPMPVPTFFPGGGIAEGMFDAPSVSGGTSFGFTDEEEMRLDLENMLADLALEQIRQGPESKVTNRLIKRANAFLLENEHTEKPREITPARWKKLMGRAISMAVRSVPLYDDKGVRTKLTIQKDVIAVVGMGPNTLLAWERHLGIDLIENELSSKAKDDEDRIENRMITGLRKRLPALAKLRLTPSFIDPALGIDGEANLQWGIASVSSIEDAEKKTDAMLSYLRTVFASNKNAACKGIALVLKHANIAGHRKANDRIFPRWTEPEVTTLIKEVMLSELWEIMGHRALREHFTDDPGMNGFINEAIFSANYAKAMRELDKIDVTEVPEEEFWKAVEDTGVEEIILENMYARMGHHH
jgi:hypothetical protein